MIPTTWANAFVLSLLLSGVTAAASEYYEFLEDDQLFVSYRVGSQRSVWLVDGRTGEVERLGIADGSTGPVVAGSTVSNLYTVLHTPGLKQEYSQFSNGVWQKLAVPAVANADHFEILRVVPAVRRAICYSITETNSESQSEVELEQPIKTLELRDLGTWEIVDDVNVPEGEDSAVEPMSFSPPFGSNRNFILAHEAHYTDGKSQDVVGLYSLEPFRKITQAGLPGSLVRFAAPSGDRMPVVLRVDCKLAPFDIVIERSTRLAVSRRDDVEANLPTDISSLYWSEKALFVSRTEHQELRYQNLTIQSDPHQFPAGEWKFKVSPSEEFAAMWNDGDIAIWSISDTPTELVPSIGTKVGYLVE